MCPPASREDGGEGRAERARSWEASGTSGSGCCQDKASSSTRQRCAAHAKHGERCIMGRDVAAGGGRVLGERHSSRRAGEEARRRKPDTWWLWRYQMLRRSARGTCGSPKQAAVHCTRRRARRGIRLTVVFFFAASFGGAGLLLAGQPEPSGSAVARQLAQQQFQARTATRPYLGEQGHASAGRCLCGGARDAY